MTSCTEALTKRCRDFSCHIARRGTNSDFVAAIRILVKFYSSGKDSVPKLSTLLRRMSLAVAQSRCQLEKTKKQAKESKSTSARGLTASQSKINTFFKKKMRNYLG